MKDNKRIAGAYYSPEQRAWLRKEATRIGGPITSVQRNLVQEKIEAEKAIADKVSKVIN